MTTIDPCSATHPTLGYPCERGTHAGPHAAYGLSWVDLPDDLPPIQHMAAVGLVGMEIQHPSGECAWCDAERWRSPIPSAVAGFRPEQIAAAREILDDDSQWTNTLEDRVMRPVLRDLLDAFDAFRARLATSEAERERYRVALERTAAIDCMMACDALPGHLKCPPCDARATLRRIAALAPNTEGEGT